MTKLKAEKIGLANITTPIADKKVIRARNQNIKASDVTLRLL